MEIKYQKSIHKEKLRKELLHRRSLMTKEQVALCSRQICDHILNSAEFIHGRFLYLYHPLGNEVDLRPIAKEALRQGKQIAFPKMLGEEIIFCRIEDINELQPGKFQIMEPNIKNRIEFQYPLVFVPGVGFDRSFNRIGHGKGYYDRFFRSANLCKKIGVAYDYQIQKKLPIEYFDISMDMLVTEYGVFHGSF